jgi:hypothetical protein
MTETASGFRSELRDTYRDPLSATDNTATEATAPTEKVVAENVATEQTEQTEQTTPAAAKKVYAGAGVIESESTPAIIWTREQRVRFTLLISGFSMLVALVSWVAMIFTASGAGSIAKHDVLAMLFGLALSGINIGLAVSIILWQLLKSGRNMTLPLAFSNLFLLLVNVPLGIAIGVNLYYITGGNIQMKELLTAPFELTARFYWLPFIVMPAAMIAWQLELMLIKRFFSGTAPHSAGGFSASSGGFTVRQRNVAARCDICHKDDEFIAKTSFCRRCQRYTF